MELEYATTEEIISELKSRPIKFVFGYFEQSPFMPSNGVHVGGMDIYEGIIMVEDVFNYMLEVSDEFEED